MSKEFNGWTNYETWKAYLEFFEGMGPNDPNELENILMEDIENNSNGIAKSYAMDAINNINFYEISKHLGE